MFDLELQAGSLIFGNVVANAAGANDVLRLGGSANASFDVSTIGAAAQYQNFDAFQKVGTGTWSLIGAGTATTNWTIQQGTLQIGNGGASGSIIGNVTNNATLAFNRSNTYSFAGIISGTGAVNQIGTGTTVLTGLNSYGGGTTISGEVIVGVRRQQSRPRYRRSDLQWRRAAGDRDELQRHIPRDHLGRGRRRLRHR